MSELKLGLEEGVAYLKKNKISNVDIYLKCALAPNSLRVCYLCSLISLSQKAATTSPWATPVPNGFDIPDAKVYFPYDAKWQPLVDMYFDDGKDLRPAGFMSRSEIIDNLVPFEEKHKASRYKGTARQRAELFFQMVRMLERNNVGYSFSSWGPNMAKIILDWLTITCP